MAYNINNIPPGVNCLPGPWEDVHDIRPSASLGLVPMIMLCLAQANISTVSLSMRRDPRLNGECRKSKVRFDLLVSLRYSAPDLQVYQS